MLRVNLSETGRYCDGVKRRSFLQLGMAGMASVGLPAILRAKEAAAETTGTKKTSVILFWLDGGPSHLDLYDLKPQAPLEYRGMWNPIPTNAPGMEISELFPLQAKCADKFSLIRSLHHDNGDHFTAGHYILTGRGGVNGSDTAQRSPFIGAAVTSVTGARKGGMPPHVAIPYAMSIGLRPGYFGAKYVGLGHNPFETDVDPNADGQQVRNLQLPHELSMDRLNSRVALLKDFDRLRRDVDQRGVFEALDRFEQSALNLVTGDAARKAFDLSSESPEMRARYGRHQWGQSALLARRLVEAGTTFVTIHLGGWDHHWNLKQGMEDYLPRVDQSVSALFTDLAERGMSDDVLVMLCGEFSRTPRMNDGGNGGAPMSMGTPGRDHWGNAMFCLMGGGGVKGGRVVGSTGARGEEVKDRPVRPSDIHHTMFNVLGVSPELAFLDHTGRPVPALEPGSVITELL